eukprot:TRINITY_DN15158_c0_g1_i2.p1 TRINITY_DN15158_c0_g1~~TRINITY_DN15158_c0_g1_i2.p1  ORF type:complete len:468 (-),score=74.66 TRINITY_DN15158_c0_g1_i2:30-1433(-)
MERKPHMSICLIGHVDSGKTMLFSFMLLKLYGFSDSMVDNFTVEFERTHIGALPKKINASNIYSYFFERRRVERDRGITIDLCYRSIHTNNYQFTLIDAPGHRDFQKNTIVALSQCEAAILVISARFGDFEAGISKEVGMTKQHAIMAYTFGVKQLIVCVSHMDDREVNWSKHRFDDIVKEMQGILKRTGYALDKVAFIPVSGWYGENIDSLTPNAPWYKGFTFREALNNLKLPPCHIDKPLTMVVNRFYKIAGIGTVCVGKIEMGVIKPGMKISLCPNGEGKTLTTEVKSIELHYENLNEAKAGDNVAINIKNIFVKELTRGMIISEVSNPFKVVTSFTATIIILNHSNGVKVGYTPNFFFHCTHLPCKIVEIVMKLDQRSGRELSDLPNIIKSGEAAIVKISPLKLLCVSPYSEVSALGRFLVCERVIIAVGIIKTVEFRQETEKPRAKKLLVNISCYFLLSLLY